MTARSCVLWVAVACALTMGGGKHPAAQVADSTAVTYLTPLWPTFVSASSSDIAAQAARLRARIGEGGGLKLGFGVYVSVALGDWHVDVTNPTAVRAALGTFEDLIRNAVDRARAENLALVITLLTPIRSSVDPAQTVSFAEDRRVMQWYSDQTVATGWWTYSRYARRQYAVREAYMREVAKILATYMDAYPDTLVGVAGDGEVELAVDRIDDVGGPVLADYSPFAIAEFRDWLRGSGLYAAGQPFEGQAYELAARYAGDATPGDTSGDGISLNGDFGTSFTTWSLKYFDWSLADPTTSDPNAISAATYLDPAFDAASTTQPLGFDAPRTRDASAWWQLWARFRETMIWRHNRDLARWITTSVNDGGRSVPVTRWFSYQIPADYIFGHTPETPDARYLTSASPWWSANVLPYGGLGFTAFGTNQGGGAVARTLPGLLNAIRECPSGDSGPTCLAASGGLPAVPWGLFEWNPVVPGESDPSVYLDEIERLRRFRPTILVPYAWDYSDHPILDSGFETALRRFASLVADGWAPTVTLNRAAISMAATRAGGRILSQTPAQSIAVGQPTGGTVDWAASSDQPWLVAAGAGHGDGTFSVTLDAAVLPTLSSGTHTATVTVAAPGSVSGTQSVGVTLRLVDGAQAASPFGAMDTPENNATGVSGAIPVTGWALDDVGVQRVEIWRDCNETIDRPRSACVAVHGGTTGDYVYVGQAAFLPGARPDVEALNPSVPEAYRAGWGYLLLTNALPNIPAGRTEGGQGTFTLFAFAVDGDGRYSQLGARTVTLDNDGATLPFGSIDTPDQGGTVTGTLTANFGWAMAQGGRCIDTTSTASYRVYIDSIARPLVAAENWFAGLARTDLAAAYPGRCNSDNALAAYYLNTATLGLSNGLHTIGWDVTDDLGRTAGIGSRFFNVQTSASDPVARRDQGPDLVAEALAARRWPVSQSRQMSVVVGGGDSAVALHASSDGVYRAQVVAGTHVQVDLGGAVAGGYLRVGDAVRALPLGASLESDRGRLSWLPMVGFVGAYALTFATEQARLELELTLLDPTANRDLEATIDRPGPGDSLSGTFSVAGWAVDPGATVGAGIDAVHVWAYRIDDTRVPPVFLGRATLGLRRPDVARVLGPMAETAGFALQVAPLPPGLYDLIVYPRPLRTGQWTGAKTVRVSVR